MMNIKATAMHEGREVTGTLTGNGAGSYTGMEVDGKIVAVRKSTVKGAEQMSHIEGMANMTEEDRSFTVNAALAYIGGLNHE